MADVVLVYPKTGFDIQRISVDLPLSLLAAASLVSQQYSVKIIDQRLDADWAHQLEEELKSQPLCIGVTAMTGPQILFALEIAKFVKERSSVPLVWGGVHATLQCEQTLRSPLIDIVIPGEGEVSFLNLVRALEAGRDLWNVKGIAFKKNGLIIRPDPEPPIDLNNLPPLPYHLVDVERYVGNQGRFTDNRTRSLIFFSSRGCPYHCAYCCNQGLYHGTWRSMSAERTFQKASELVTKYHLDAVTFHDDDLFIDRRRIEKLADLIGGRFGWWGQSRMDKIEKTNLAKLERGGLRALQPGIESGSTRILRLIQKNETVDIMLKANRMLAHTTIKPLYNFMMGFPTETYEDLLQSVDLASRLLDENPNAEITGFYVYLPYPGTDLFDLSVRHGFKPPNSLEGWAVYNRQRLTELRLPLSREIYESIMVMSKFIDGTRMARRLRDHSDAGAGSLFLLRQLAKLYGYRWRRHEFDKRLEMMVTSWVKNHLFHWN